MAVFNKLNLSKEYLEKLINRIDADTFQNKMKIFFDNFDDLFIKQENLQTILLPEAIEELKNELQIIFMF